MLLVRGAETEEQWWWEWLDTSKEAFICPWLLILVDLETKRPPGYSRYSLSRNKVISTFFKNIGFCLLEYGLQAISSEQGKGSGNHCRMFPEDTRLICCFSQNNWSRNRKTNDKMLPSLAPSPNHAPNSFFMVCPHLGYCVRVWSPHLRDKSIKLEKVQKKA